MSSNNADLPRYSNLQTTEQAKSAILAIVRAAVEADQVLLAHHTSLDQTSLEAALAELIAESVIAVQDVSAPQRKFTIAT